jgi:hypothetical protein
MHQAKDGSLHKTAALCAEKNIQLRLAPAIDAFVEKLTAEQVGSVEGHPAIALEELPAFLIAHSTSLRKLLNDALIERKPRKKDATPKTNTPAPTPKAEEKPVEQVKPAAQAPADVAAANTAPDAVDDILADLGA